METLRIHLFGTMQVYSGVQPTPVAMSRMSQILLAYLLLQPNRVHSRSVLTNLLWGDRSEEQARNCLNTALWRLRLVLEPDTSQRGAFLLTTSAGEIGLNAQQAYWLDVAQFESSMAVALRCPLASWSAANATQVKDAAQLYSGDLLEGIYEDWALRERERLRELYLQGMVHLMNYYRQHSDLVSSQRCAQQILYVDPLREEVHRTLIALFWEQGQRTSALQQYRTCCELLDRELGVPPMPETQTLAQQIVSGETEALSTTAACAQPALLQTGQLLPRIAELPEPRPLHELLLQQISQAMQLIIEANAAMQATALLVEQLLSSQYTPPGV